MKSIKRITWLVLFLPTLGFGQEAAMRAFASLTNDTFSARGSLRLPDREIQSGEIKCIEITYGEAMVCKADAPTVVVGTVRTLPPSAIHLYWLTQISNDFLELRRTWVRECQESKEKCVDAAKFVEDTERSYNNEDGAVWRQLAVAYCKEMPSSGYPDLHGRTSYCSE